MNENITSFGKWCRKLRFDKGLSMANVAEKLGCKQNHITQIEQGKTNPTPDFLIKCLDVYEISKTEKFEFLTQALASSNRFILNKEKVTILSNDNLARLMTILVFNLKEYYSETNEGNIFFQLTEKEISNNMRPYTIILP